MCKFTLLKKLNFYINTVFTVQFFISLFIFFTLIVAFIILVFYCFYTFLLLLIFFCDFFFLRNNNNNNIIYILIRWYQCWASLMSVHAYFLFSDTDASPPQHRAIPQSPAAQHADVTSQRPAPSLQTAAQPAELRPQQPHAPRHDL